MAAMANGMRMASRWQCNSRRTDGKHAAVDGWMAAGDQDGDGQAKRRKRKRKLERE